MFLESYQNYVRLQRSNPTTVKAFQFAKAKIKKVNSQYHEKIIYFEKEVKDLSSSCNHPVNMDAIINFVRG